MYAKQPIVSLYQRFIYYRNFARNIGNVGRIEHTIFLLIDLINFRAVTIMFKAKQNILPPNLHHLFQFGNINIYDTGQSDCFNQCKQ